MTDHDDTAGRTTAPQSPYGAHEVRIGALVLIVGAIIAFVVPYFLL